MDLWMPKNLVCSLARTAKHESESVTMTLTQLFKYNLTVALTIDYRYKIFNS